MKTGDKIRREYLLIIFEIIRIKKVWSFPGFSFNNKRIVTYLYKKPRRDKSQTAVLPVESIMVGIEGEVIEVEESENQELYSLY